MSVPAGRPAPLPIDPVLPGLCDALRDKGAAVLVAPPGSGKTTRVPPALLASGLAGGGKILLLQPRRVAARLCARRMAWERGEEVGDTIGYRVRFEDKSSARTRILVLTEGLLTRKLVADPLLLEASIVVLDEFHERSLASDLALTMLAELRASVRDDLRIVVMSATMDPEPVARFLGGAPVVKAEGRQFPVAIEYDPRPATTPLAERVARSVSRHLDEEPVGHVLVFLPGVGEIERAADHIATLRVGQPGWEGVEVLPLHGRLPGPEQDRALAPTAGRKVVLATNVAETSVTLEGVRTVIDSGLVRSTRWEAGLGLDRLELGPISRASADQRAGRAGRTGPGRCRRLWTEADDQRRPAWDTPEVRRADLAPVVLDLLAWGGDPHSTPWFEPPPRSQVDAAYVLLRSLGAVDAGGAITPLGRRLAALPLHPRMGRVLVEASRLGVLTAAATVAALVEAGDPFRDLDVDPSDPIGSRLLAVAEAEWKGRAPRGVDRGAWERFRRTRDQLLGAAEQLPTQGGPQGDPEDPLCLHRALLAGLADRLCVRRSPGSDRLRRVGDKGAVLDARCALPGHEILLALDLDVGARGAEARVRLAMPMPAEALTVVERIDVRFDENRLAVSAHRVRACQGLVLEDLGAAAIPSPGEAERILVEAARDRAEIALQPSAHARATRARMLFLLRHGQGLDLPPVPSWDEVVRRCAPGCRSFADLRRADHDGAVREGWSWAQLRLLDEHCPASLLVPTGSAVTIQWPDDGEGQPVLAARIQQLFGLAETPRVTLGRVPVLIHLLAPSGRPQQVTADLRSFWAGAYHEVRRELRIRYPRHSWPDDPWNATPEDRPKRRPRPGP